MGKKFLGEELGVVTFLTLKIFYHRGSIMKRLEIQGGNPSVVEIHPSIDKVIKFMEREVLADDLQGVAEAIAKLAPALWGHLDKNEIVPIRILHPL